MQIAAPFDWITDIVKLILIALSLELSIRTFLRAKAPHWSRPLETRRLTVLFILVALGVAIKVTEDVLGHESGPIDEAILWRIHQAPSPGWNSMFEVITFTGSSAFLLPIAAVVSLALLQGGYLREATLLLSSSLSAPLLVYLLKTLIGRARPDLWEARAYWGSSFPSGHTLAVASVTTALALCVGRLWPRFRVAAFGGAFVWTALVALSRLVIGVHWPTDVLTAASLGAVIPLALLIVMELMERMAQPPA